MVAKLAFIKFTTSYKRPQPCAQPSSRVFACALEIFVFVAIMLAKLLTELSAWSLHLAAIPLNLSMCTSFAKTLDTLLF